MNIKLILIDVLQWWKPKSCVFTLQISNEAFSVSTVYTRFQTTITPKTYGNQMHTVRKNQHSLSLKNQYYDISQKIILTTNHPFDVRIQKKI